MGNLEEKLEPWKRDKSEVELIKNYRAKIVLDKKNLWGVEFIDYDESYITTSISKDKFETLPYECKIGTNFWIVIYRIRSEEEYNFAVWPMKKFWHECWKNN